MLRSLVLTVSCAGLTTYVDAQAVSDVYYNQPGFVLSAEISQYVAMIEELESTGVPAAGGRCGSVRLHRARSQLVIVRSVRRDAANVGAHSRLDVVLSQSGRSSELRGDGRDRQPFE